MSDVTQGRDSPEVIERIAVSLDLVDMLARQMRRQFGSHVQVDDLSSHGHEALVLAARSFDPEKGLPFRRWANLRIRGAMLDAVRAQGNLPRRVYRAVRAMQAAEELANAYAEESPPPSPEAADAKIDEQLDASAFAMALGFLTMRRGDIVERVADERPRPEEEVAEAELVVRIRAAIDERPEQERQLLQRHYFDEVTLDEAAKELGLSRSWASRLHARAIEGIAKSMKRDVE